MEVITQLQGPEYCPDDFSQPTPLFIVHAVSGLAMHFMYLHPLHEDDARPVYGISSPMHCVDTDDFVWPAKLRGLSEYYIQKIRDIQPEGPYLLAGWSLGGMIAMDMAQALTAEGEDVLKVIMIDASNPEAFPSFTDSDEDKLFSRIIFDRSLNPGAPTSASEQKKLLTRINESPLLARVDEDEEIDDGSRSTWGQFNSASIPNAASLSMNMSMTMAMTAPEIEIEEVEDCPLSSYAPSDVSMSSPRWSPSSPDSIECSSQDDDDSDCESIKDLDLDMFDTTDPFARFRENNFNGSIFVDAAAGDDDDDTRRRRPSCVTVSYFDNVDPFTQFREDIIEEEIEPLTKADEARRTSFLTIDQLEGSVGPFGTPKLNGGSGHRRSSIHPLVLESALRRSSVAIHSPDVGSSSSNNNNNHNNHSRRRQSCFNLGNPFTEQQQHSAPPQGGRRRSVLLGLALDVQETVEASRRASCINIINNNNSATNNNVTFNNIGYGPPRSSFHSARVPSGLGITSLDLQELNERHDPNYLSPRMGAGDFFHPNHHHHHSQRRESILSVTSAVSNISQDALEDALGHFASLGGEGMDEEQFIVNIKRHVNKALRLMATVQPGELLPAGGEKTLLDVVLVKCMKQGAWTQEPVDGEADMASAKAIRQLMLEPTMGWDADRFGKFSTLPFSGDHDSAFGPDHVGELSNVLRQALEDVY